jgi:nucleotide-binding universal stress UspA family protein
MPQHTRSHRVFHSILCPVDFSSNSRAALRYAATLARRSGCSLIVMYVDDPLLALAAATRRDAQTLIRASERDLRRFVTRALDTAPRAMPVTLVTTAGNVPREIMKTAERHGCDLIVMGYRGVGAASKFLFGSTTEGVVRLARVPVLAIPPARRRTAPVVHAERSRLRRAS